MVGFGVAIGMLVAKSTAQNNADAVAAAIRGQHPPSGVCSSTDSATVKKFGAACQALQDDDNAVNSDATAGNIAIGVGVIALVGTAIYYFAAPKKDAADMSTTSSRPIVTPMVGAHVGGLSISGSF